MERDKIKQKYVLITSSNFPFGGAGANYLNLFCKGLILNGFLIRVFLLKGFAFASFTNKSPRKNITDYGVPYTYLSFTQRPKNVFMKFCERKRYFDNGVDLIMAESENTGLAKDVLEPI